MFMGFIFPFFFMMYLKESFIHILSFGFLLSLASCRPQVAEIDLSMILESYSISVEEPSGLCFSIDKQSFYTVSDQGFLYQISLYGEMIRKLPYTGVDFEAVTCVGEEENIFICEEGKGDLLKLSHDGTLLERYSIIETPGNSGLEGLTFNETLNEFYLLKEKTPGLLYVYSIVDRTLRQITLNFAYDYSGIFFNKASNKLWIVSDESKTLNQCDLNGTLIKSYDIPIGGVEGIVVNEEETIAYVVSDPNKKLYKLDLTVH